MSSRVRTIICFLIVGACITIAVCVILSYRDDEPLRPLGASRPVRYAMHGTRGWIVNVSERFGTTHLSALPGADLHLSDGRVDADPAVGTGGLLDDVAGDLRVTGAGGGRQRGRRGQ